MLNILSRWKRNRKSESQLRASEERFRSLTELSSDAYWEQDDQYRFTSFLGSIPQWLRMQNKESIGKKRWERDYFNRTPADWAAHIADLDARRPFRDLELGRVTEAGEKVWVSVSGEPVFDDSGAFKGYRGVGRDISERKRAEQLQVLEHRVARCLAEAGSASAGLKAVIREVCETETWECGRYFRWDESGGILRFGDAWGIADAAIDLFIEKSREISYTPGVGLSGRTWQTGQPVWVSDVSSDSRVATRTLFQNTGMRCAFVFPVISEGKRLGVLAFNSRKIREPDEKLLQAVLAIGSQVGQFLQRKDAEEDLRRFRIAMDNSADMIVLIDRTTMRFVDVNNTACRLLGYSREKLLQMGPQDVLPSSRAELERAYDEFIADPSQTFGTQSHYRRKDGSTFPFESTRHALRSGGSYVIAAISRDISARIAAEEALKTSNERLAYLAQFDSLTELPNRNLFHDRLAQGIVQAKRRGRSTAVLFIDLDRFKLVNDALGHGAGDRLLKEAAARLTGSLREGDSVSRFGGDEFGAILSDLGKPGDASPVTQKILEALAQPFHLDGHETYLTASVGIALFPSDGEDADTLLRHADAAMSRAKEQGRNNAQFFTLDMNKRAQGRMHLEGALRRAIADKEFRLHYQPKIDLSSGAICGLEALLRWQRPGIGLVSPLDFIPVLEDTGLIVPVGEWVLREALAQLLAWQKAGVPVTPVAVNLSARQFQEKRLEETVSGILRETGVDASLLHFELTESLLMKDPEIAARTLGTLKNLGVSVSVDDFGTGYSSLAYLKRFPLDALKIDRAFIRDVTSDADDAAITSAIIGLAGSLKLKVIAEGVETEDQLRFLGSHGCDEVQGFYFAKPAGAEDCALMLTEGFEQDVARVRGSGSSSWRGAARPSGRTKASRPGELLLQPHQKS